MSTGIWAGTAVFYLFHIPLLVTFDSVPEPGGFAALKRLLLGQPIPSHLAHHERLSRVTGLAVLSSDALSSVAYATDFILATLVVAGLGAFHYALPISGVVAELMIGYVQQGIRPVYDRWNYLEEQRSGFELWAARLRGIVEQPPENVVLLREAAH